MASSVLVHSSPELFKDLWIPSIVEGELTQCWLSSETTPFTGAVRTRLAGLTWCSGTSFAAAKFKSGTIILFCIYFREDEPREHFAKDIHEREEMEIRKL